MTWGQASCRSAPYMIVRSAMLIDLVVMPDKSQRHPSMSMCMQVDKYKYLVWVPGNCASVRLALQLASDAAVLKVIIRASPPLSQHACISARGISLPGAKFCEGCSAGSLSNSVMPAALWRLCCMHLESLHCVAAVLPYLPMIGIFGVSRLTAQSWSGTTRC